MPLPPRNLSARVALALSTAILFAGSLATAQTAITTYHVDNNRTGWNSHETVLTPANATMAPMTFEPEEVTIYGKVLTVLRRL